ncbi:MAG: hypothetical protein AUJ75_03585 [Candidatus Omnitrophica bacterium CG1_02_49_10]|nr:MAG: hypothetical protein AUJ75_03585 [Candidatus Omnitrophica bacterium CG1_02_49_10]
MSIHPSLSASGKGKRHRSVLKRRERISILKEKEKWSEEQSLFGLPKVKSMKIKIKKEKEKVEEGAEVKASTPAPAGGPETKKVTGKK